VVHQLVLPHSQGGCPWVAKQTPSSLLGWLRSEVEEVAEQLEEVQVGKGGVESKEKLEAELGDLAFDALLLISVCRRDHHSARPESPYKRVSDKVRRRVPYIWGTAGEKADNAEEAEAHWQRVKAEEKLEDMATEEETITKKGGGEWAWSSVMMFTLFLAGGAAAWKNDVSLHDLAEKVTAAKVKLLKK